MAMMASRTWDASSTFTRFVTSFWLRRECIGSAAIIRVCLLREQGYLSPFPTGSVAGYPPKGTPPTAIPLGQESPPGSSHLPAGFGRADRSGFFPTTPAYLVLLRMEVAAFHPRFLRRDSSLWPCSSCRHAGWLSRIPLYGARTFLCPALTADGHSGCLADSRAYFMPLPLGRPICRTNTDILQQGLNL